MISGRLAGILAAERGRFNAAFASARASHPALDQDGFAAHLRGPVALLVGAVDQCAPEQCPAVAAALYNISLELFSRDMLGARARSSLLQRAWVQLLPLLTVHLAASPVKLVAGIMNAIHNLAKEAEGVGGAWLEGMIAVAPFCRSGQDVLNCGMVLAWRCGLPHYRRSALSAWSGLPRNLKLLVLRLDPETFAGDLEAMGQRLRTDLWYRPGGRGGRAEIEIVAVCGGFRGLGGPFISPPEVCCLAGELVAIDSECRWVLYADAFGAVFKRGAIAGDAEESRNCPSAGIRKDGTVFFGEMTRKIHELGSFSSYASTPDTLIVALKESHYVYLVAPVAGI